MALRLNMLARTRAALPLHPAVASVRAARPPQAFTVASQLAQQRRSLASSSRAGRAPVPNSPSPQSPLVPKNAQSASASRPPPQTQGQFWYREVFPSMIPIFVLSTAIFLALSLIRTHLSHNKSLEESREKIDELERQLARTKLELKRRQERERKERERMLPLVVERVLQRVGAMDVEEEEPVVEEDVRLVV